MNWLEPLVNKLQHTEFSTLFISRSDVEGYDETCPDTIWLTRWEPQFNDLIKCGELTANWRNRQTGPDKIRLVGLVINVMTFDVEVGSQEIRYSSKENVDRFEILKFRKELIGTTNLFDTDYFTNPIDRINFSVSFR